MRKRLSNEEKVVAALDALDKAERILLKFGDKYNRHIDEAALRGDEARAKQLIKQKIRVYALTTQLKTLKGNIELGIFTSQAISELGTLPAAIAGCKGLLAESPDFSKLGKSIMSIFKDISKSEDELAKLNDILAPKPATSVTSRLDGVPEDELSDEFKAEYREMIERLKGPTTEPIIKPSVTAATATGDIDYAGIVEELNKKK